MCKSQRLFRSVIAIAWATVVAVPALAAAQDQVNAADRAKAEAEARAQAIERNTRENARQLTPTTSRAKSSPQSVTALYNQPVLSPDATRVAVIKADLAKETNDLWIVDVASGRGTQNHHEQVARAGAGARLVPGRKGRRLCGPAR